MILKGDAFTKPLDPSLMLSALGYDADSPVHELAALNARVQNPVTSQDEMINR